MTNSRKPFNRHTVYLYLFACKRDKEYKGKICLVWQVYFHWNPEAKKPKIQAYINKSVLPSETQAELKDPNSP